MMDSIELKNYSESDLLLMLKSKENELSMIKGTYEAAKQNNNSSEGGLVFLNQQITELTGDIGRIKSELMKCDSSEKKPYVKPEIKYISSNVAMADLVNKINECTESKSIADYKLEDVIPIKKRSNRYKVATNNRFSVYFDGITGIDNSQIKSVNLALAGDKKVIIEFFDYVYRTPENGTICLEKVLYDAKEQSWDEGFTISISSFDEEGLELKREIFKNCHVTDIYTRGMYSYSDDEIRTISGVFDYKSFDVEVPLVDYETDSKEEQQ